MFIANTVTCSMSCSICCLSLFIVNLIYLLIYRVSFIATVYIYSGEIKMWIIQGLRSRDYVVDRFLRKLFQSKNMATSRRYQDYSNRGQTSANIVSAAIRIQFSVNVAY